MHASLILLRNRFTPGKQWIGYGAGAAADITSVLTPLVVLALFNSGRLFFSIPLRPCDLFAFPPRPPPQQQGAQDLEVHPDPAQEPAGRCRPDDGRECRPARPLSCSLSRAAPSSGGWWLRAEKDHLVAQLHVPPPRSHMGFSRHLPVPAYIYIHICWMEPHVSFSF